MINDKNTRSISSLVDSVARPTAPDILIHMHIPKTGGTSLNSMLQHAFPSDEVADTMVIDDRLYNGLGVASYDLCVQRLTSYSAVDLRRIRYVTGHLCFGVHRIFNRPAKYFTVIRNPVDRVISDFFFRIQENEAYLKDGKPLSFEEYVEAQQDVFLRDYQVRVISGSAELEAARCPPGMQTPGPQVTSAHLEQAKRNIEEHFLTAAPLENILELALLIRKVYRWPMRRMLTEYKARTRQRPRMHDVSPRTLKTIEECNANDIALYHWASERFALQQRLFEPDLARDQAIFTLVSNALNSAGRIVPWSLRKRLAQLLFYA